MGAFSFLDIVPRMKAFSGGTQALRSGSKLASLSNNVLKGMKKIPSKVANATEKMKDALRKYDLNLSSGRRGADDIIGGSSKVANYLDEVPKIKEVPYGEHIIKGKGGRKELAPHTRYVTEDGYKYTTDKLGRVVDVEADSLVLKAAERNEGMQKVAGREDRLLDDDGGHLIGSQFNGPGDIDNLVAQNRQINRSGGKWYEMEQEWENALKETPPRKVSVKIVPQYSGESLRPDKFKVIYQVEGERSVTNRIMNKAGG